MGAKRRIRLDTLMDILEEAVIDTHEDFEVARRRKTVEGRYRLRRQHSTHAVASRAYKSGKITIENTDDGWDVTTRNGKFHISEEICDCPGVA
ncbi:hypothetical protein ANCCAN_11718 [Ancylostoma caninum]|uniref:Uncharacterized protein n=1 Tax=Ancylostoma caninum TaxID=29170 RepID=A0A368GH39_ANCCA|nr:hypothetical protein ANCCAN_11718 [Ancylostoma caninum]